VLFRSLERHKLDVPGKGNLIALIASELDARGRYAYTSTQEKLALFLVGREMVAARDGTPWTLRLTDRADEKTLTHAGSLVQELSTADLSGGFKVHNPGDKKLYLELALEGHPAQMPAERSDVVSLRRKLFDAQGKPLNDPVLPAGESVWVMLAVVPKVNIANALVVDHIPAGLEIENFNIVQGEATDIVKPGGIDPAGVMRDPAIQHVEFRDDRFVAALRLDRYGGGKTLFYRAKAVTPGRFVFPPTYAEDMYRPEVYGLTEGQKTLTVTNERSSR
jgi:uncharacterized protein YfaS (alpha-2-macroglobulin family)